MRACRLSVAVLVVALTASRAVAQPASAPATAPARGEIGRLIRELGDDRWAVREEATRRLREMGPAAAQALREALQSADLEVKSRSRKLLDTLALGGESDLAVARQKVLWAFRKADYGAAVEVARRVVNHGDSGMSDWLWLGHCCQLGGDWAGAAGAYRKVVEFLDADVQSGRKTPEAPEVPARRGKMLNVIEGNEGSWVGPVAPGGPQPLSDRERAEMTRQRTQMMLSIAHIQRHEMKAPAQAAKTLGEALDFLEAGKGTIDDGWMSIAIADERPVCLHEAGDLAGAVEAWKRAAAWRTKLKRVETDTPIVDVDRIFAEIRALPAGATPPPVPWIISLPADGAATKLDIDDEATRQRAYRRGTYSDFALAPPPGKEFDTVEFACDIEQFNPRMGGQFSCSVATAVPPGGRKHLGSIGWPREKRRASEVGRETVTQGFVVPAGAGLVHMQIGTSARKEFVVHSVVVKATYRAITNNPPPICADAWAQMELLPASGRLTWGPKVLANATAISGLAPGRETLRFSAPGDTRTIEMPFQVTPGGRCGLFVNLDSPFRWRQIELAIGGDRGVSDPNLSVQRLGKEFVAVWCNPAGKLLSARSGDLAAWSPPEVLPFGAVFSNIAPATYLAADGTMWLAYFSNRLSPMETGSGGYHLWLTSTPDGKAWAPPRKIDVQTVDGWPLNPPVMLTDQAGGTWLFCRNFAGSVAAGETLDKLTALQPLARAKRGEKVLNMWNFQVAREGADGFRMVFDDFGAGIYTMVSRKGLAWGDPRPLVTEPPGTADNAAGQIAHVCLIRDQGRAMLLYSWRGGSYLTPVDPDGPAVVAGQGVKIASSLVPVVGRTPIEHEGRLFFIAGDSATWLLEVDLKTLLAVPASRPSPGAGIRN